MLKKIKKIDIRRMGIFMNKIIALILIICAQILTTGFSVSAASSIECTPTVNGRTVNITGRVTGVSEGKYVALLVGNTDKIENIMYLNQTETGENGEFCFDFSMPTKADGGMYEFKVGSNAPECPTYTSVLEYVAQRKFLTADIYVDIKNYTPTISGTLSCSEGKSININITDVTGQTVIADDIISFDNGLYNLSYTLPSLLSARDYTLTILCKEGNETLASMSVTINSSILLVSITGDVTTADDVMIDASVNGGEIISKSTNFTGSDSVSATLPNIAANTTIHMSANGFREVKAFEEPEIQATTYIVNGTSKEKFVVPVSVHNFPVFESKTFKLSYNSDELSIVNPKRQGENDFLNIQIVSDSSGELIFSCTPGITGEGTISGVLNLFEMEFNENFSGISELMIEVM